MELEKLEATIEAVLFAMGNAVSVEKIATAIGHDTETTRKLVHQMMDVTIREKADWRSSSLMMLSSCVPDGNIMMH